MAVVAFPARNKLVYPAGRPAGFDPNHPAAGARSGTFSGIATPGGTFANLLSPAKGTEGGTKTSSIYGPLGPVTNYLQGGGANTDSTVFPFTSVANTALTLGGIFKIVTGIVNAAYLLNTSAGGAVGIGDAGTGTFNGFYNAAGSATYDTGISYVLGASYFHAVSFNTLFVTWVVVRLDTGQIFSGTIANTIAGFDAGDGTITVGSRGTNTRQINGGVAAAMASNAFMSEQQLRQWSADPWAFWYPPQASSLVAAAAATPTTVLYQLMNVG